MVLGCVNATAALGQRNVFVSCELVARPVDVQLYWVIDDNGTTVAETQVVDEYWTLLMVSFFPRRRRYSTSSLYVIRLLMPAPRCRPRYVFGLSVLAFVRLLCLRIAFQASVPQSWLTGYLLLNAFNCKRYLAVVESKIEII